MTLKARGPIDANVRRLISHLQAKIDAITEDADVINNMVRNLPTFKTSEAAEGGQIAVYISQGLFETLEEFCDCKGIDRPDLFIEQVLTDYLETAD